MLQKRKHLGIYEKCKAQKALGARCKAQLLSNLSVNTDVKSRVWSLLYWTAPYLNGQPH